MSEPVFDKTVAEQESDSPEPTPVDAPAEPEPTPADEPQDETSPGEVSEELPPAKNETPGGPVFVSYSTPTEYDENAAPDDVKTNDVSEQENVEVAPNQDPEPDFTPDGVDETADEVEADGNS